MVAESDDSDDESLRIECPTLATQRLVLRAPRESDIPQLVMLADNRHVAQMLARMPHPYGEAEARTFLAMNELKRPGASYALTLAGTGTFVGCAALVDLAFRSTGIAVLHASARVINPASRRVLHKCGFQYAGQGMMNSLVVGQVPVERYRLDRKTWHSLRSW